MPDPAATTQKRISQRPRARRVAVPCLTIVTHADARRIGERALLTALLVGQQTEITRLSPEFAIVDRAEPARPLSDPFLSRRTICIIATAPSGDLSVEPAGSDVALDGEPLAGPRAVTREQLARGVLLSLSDRVAMLLHETSNPPQCPVEGILGSSDAIAAVRAEVERLSGTSAPVLVRGETGAGKECVARAIHDLSARSVREWVAVNMAVMPESIAAATLFGHSKGAFTGAQQRHRGVFERAAGGTLFLDEIGETPLPVQPMLLRALETGKILSVGDEAEREVDVRIIAATDAHLEQDVAQGSFRAALLHRLAGYEVRVPPLRERRDDVARLLAYFLDAELRQLGDEQGLFGEEQPEEPRLSVELVTRVLLHPLPGNVRQLRNFARHLAIASRGKDPLILDDALDRLLPSDPPWPASDSTPRSARRPGDLTDEEVLAALEAHGWAPGRAAQSLNVPTSTLHDLMQRMGIRRATDLSEQEVAEAAERCAGDLKAMARLLRVSERALRLAVRQHKPRA